MMENVEHNVSTNFLPNSQLLLDLRMNAALTVLSILISGENLV